MSCQGMGLFLFSLKPKAGWFPYRSSLLMTSLWDGAESEGANLSDRRQTSHDAYTYRIPIDRVAIIMAQLCELF